MSSHPENSPPPQTYLRTPEPNKYESGMGWLLRCAEQNGITLNKLLRAVYGYPFSPTLIANLVLQHFAEAFNKDFESISYLSYNCRGKAVFRTHMINRQDILVGAVQVCPQCVKEFGYIDALWDLRFTVACDRHGVYLTSHCQSCKHPLSYNRRGLLTCSCGADIQCEGVKVSNEVAEIQSDWRAFAYKLPYPSSGIFTYQFLDVRNFFTRNTEDPYASPKSRHEIRECVERTAYWRFYRCHRAEYERAMAMDVREKVILQGPTCTYLEDQSRLITFFDASNITKLMIATLGRLCRDGHLDHLEIEESGQYWLRLDQVLSLPKLLKNTVSEGQRSVPLTSILFWQDEKLESLVISEIFKGRIKTYHCEREWPEIELDSIDLEERVPNFRPPIGTRIHTVDAQKLTGISFHTLESLADRGDIKRYDTLTRKSYQAESITSFLEQYLKVDWFPNRDLCLKLLEHFKKKEYMYLYVQRDSIFFLKDDLRKAVEDIPAAATLISNQ